MTLEKKINTSKTYSTLLNKKKIAEKKAEIYTINGLEVPEEIKSNLWQKISNLHDYENYIQNLECNSDRLFQIAYSKLINKLGPQRGNLQYINFSRIYDNCYIGEYVEAMQNGKVPQYDTRKFRIMKKYAQIIN